MRKNPGLTLLEVLIALSILSLVLLAFNAVLGRVKIYV
ncbi:hypothetical protein CSW23_06990 [Thermus scotoductus]|uniref:Prepilin-type N-terminal cleavage/methylation domain-containing protein n=1 Tax=Thermus scotoductus TaxID=37636 RepID=A0A430V2H7_THESC|nr:hypothetical protein CSW31_07080 [Thermus scotoductus]RTI16724.1 hypothetical protein CSW23_06990 [Thermus scotoductus]